jgi:hypothetical protein
VRLQAWDALEALRRGAETTNRKKAEQKLSLQQAYEQARRKYAEQVAEAYYKRAIEGSDMLLRDAMDRELGRPAQRIETTSTQSPYAHLTDEELKAKLRLLEGGRKDEDAA